EARNIDAGRASLDAGSVVTIDAAAGLDVRLVVSESRFEVTELDLEPLLCQEIRPGASVHRTSSLELVNFDRRTNWPWAFGIVTRPFLSPHCPRTRTLT